MCRAPRHADATRGFTLIEVMIVVMLVGILLGAGTFTLRNVLRSELRSAASRTAASMRFAFNRAMMTGSFLRLAIDLEKGELWLEVSEQRVGLRKGREQDTTSERGGEDGAGPPAGQGRRRSRGLSALGLGLGVGEEGEGDLDEAAPVIDTQGLVDAYERDLEPLERPKALFQPLKGPGVRRVKLPGKVDVDAVLTPRLDDPVEEGQAYVYFFPQGHAEPAIVRLVSAGDDYYSVVLHPLTGQARVYPCRYRFPEEFGEDDLVGRVAQSPCEDR